MTQYRFKIALVGESGVGKSQFISVLGEGYNEHITPSVMSRWIGKKVNIEGHLIDINVWDRPGRTQYLSKDISSSYKNMGVVCVMYDVNNSDSMEEVKKWVNEVKSYAIKNPIIYLVGNKSDTCTDLISLTDLSSSNYNGIVEHVHSFANEYNYKHIMISNKNKKDVMQVLTIAGTDLMKDHAKFNISSMSSAIPCACSDKTIQKLVMLENNLLHHSETISESEKRIKELEKDIQKLKKNRYSY